MDANDWRAELQPHIRQIEVNEIMSILIMHQSLGEGDDDELLEVQKIAQSIEHKTYAVAASKDEYLQKIPSLMRLFDNYKYWRALLLPDSRQGIINKIMETLRRRLNLSCQGGLDKLRKAAVTLEEKIYDSATNQTDYLEKTSFAMLRLGNGVQNCGDNRHGRSDRGFVMRAPSEGERNTPGRQSIRKRKQPQWLAEFVTY